MISKHQVISVIGLGYVGLPVAIGFSKKYRVLGFDIHTQRIAELKEGYDRNHESPPVDLRNENLTFTHEIEDLKEATFHIVAVPTPVDDAKQPDLGPLIRASETVGKVLKKGDIVVYESTVYPGVTEEECAPVLERVSKLKREDFKVAYSPERINPGDSEKSFFAITKVVSGEDEDTLNIVAELYNTVVKAGIFRAQSIKIAEAAKVIENTQRDLNIALMNELAIIFDQMGIDTQSVLEAASTKWNFLRFSPGLVGGHCIGIDPYYLTHKAEKLQYHPQVILAGRRINDGMGRFIAQKTIKELIHAGQNILGSTVTILGLTFKENCRDIRNTRVIDIVRELTDYGVNVQVCDPLADPTEAFREYGIKLFPLNDLPPANALVAAVAHKDFRSLQASDIRKFTKEKPLVVDVKGIFPIHEFQSEGIRVWRL